MSLFKDGDGLYRPWVAVTCLAIALLYLIGLSLLGWAS